MGRESEDKAARILSIYSRLQQGKVICKKKESVEYQVAERTIQRDIADIQCYLQEQVQETGEIQEIVYDKSLGGYVLQTKSRMQLDEKEILAVAKVLLESRSMMKKELFPIIHKLVALCNDETKERFLEEVLKNEMFHYVELQHGKEILEVLWELEQAVKRQEYIEIRYRKVKNHAEVVRKVKPVGVMFSEFYFYLTAYIEDGDFAYPTIYRIDRFMKITRLDEYFTVPYADRFEEGEFKKRIQFMYGGKLRKIKFLYTGDSILQLCELFVVPYRTMAKRLREISLISEDMLKRFLNESEESINKYRKMYSFVLRDPDERVVMDNLVELAFTAYDEGYVTYEKLEHLLELSNMTPEDLGIKKKANYEFTSDDELDSIMEE